MVNPLRTILYKWSASIVELMLFFPLVLLAAIFLMPQNKSFLWFALLPISCLLGICIRVLIMKRLYHLVLGLLISAAVARFGFGWNFTGGVCLAATFCLLYRGVLLVEVPWKELFPVGMYWIGMLSYLFCSLLTRVLSALQPYSHWLTGLGMLCLVLTLYSTNFSNLQSAALSGSKKPVIAKTVLWHNRVYVIVVLLLAYGAANVSQIKELFAWLSHLFFSGFISAFKVLFLFPLPQVQPPHPLVHQTIIPRTPTSSHTRLISIKWAYIILAIAGAVLLRFLMPKIILLIKRMFRLLFQFFSRIFSLVVRFDIQTGYEDERERLAPKAFWKLRKLDRLKDWLMMKLRTEPRFSELTTNRQRVRYLYRQLILQSMLGGYSFKQSLTPRETGEDLSRWGRQAEPNQPLIDLYNQARYSERPISDEQMGKLENHPLP